MSGHSLGAIATRDFDLHGVPSVAQKVHCELVLVWGELVQWMTIHRENQKESRERET